VCKLPPIQATAFYESPFFRRRFAVCSAHSSSHSSSHYSASTAQVPASLTHSNDDSDASSTSSRPVSPHGLLQQLHQINESIEAHRATLEEQRALILQHIEGIVAHLQNKNHPINRGLRAAQPA